MLGLDAWRCASYRVYDTARMCLSSVVLAHESEVMSVDFSPLSGRLLASGSRDRLVHVFDARCGYRLRETLDQHSSSVTGVRYATRAVTVLVGCSRVHVCVCVWVGGCVAQVCP